MFADRLSAKVEVSIGGKTFSVVAGNVKRIAFTIEPWGFDAEAEFWLVSTSEQSEDTLFAAFLTRDLATATITVGRTYDEVEEEATTTVLHGIVIEKSVTERAFTEIANDPILQRRYTIRVVDRARALWRQHYPSALYVDSTFKDLIDDNKPEGLVLVHAWTGAETKYPVLSLGLGGAQNQASFYDFVHWLLWRESAALYYDVGKNAYAIVDKKPPASSNALRREEVATLEAIFPPTPRGMVSVLNGDANAATKKKEIPNLHAVAGVRRDYIIRSSVTSDLDTRAVLEAARARLRDPEARVTFKSYPAVPFVPSMQVTFGEGFSTNVYQNGKTYRVARTQVVAVAESQIASDDADDESNAYNLEYTLGLELASDPVFRYPEFVTPRWPFHVEGKVLSEVGKDEEGTYQPYRNETTSLEYYKVKIPLWGDKKVIVSYQPSLVSGHFYFPVYKDARVLIALDFQAAAIDEFLDWRPGARLPLETQGNQILVGKGATNETSIRHAYENAKPAFTIQRSSAKDEQVIKVSEGTIRFETQEKD